VGVQEITLVEAEASGTEYVWIAEKQRRKSKDGGTILRMLKSDI